MFCPTCRDEFRPGFTRCGRCDVELVDDLSKMEERPAPRERLPPPPIKMVDYCGFFSMQEVRHAREQLRRQRIPTEIVVREPPGADWDAPAQDEFWIRVDASRIKEAQSVIETLEGRGAESQGATFGCSECGQEVAEAESFCPKCGARFD